MYWFGDWIVLEFVEEFKGYENDYDVIVLFKKDRKVIVIYGLGWVVLVRLVN